MPEDPNKIKALNRFLDPEDKKEVKIEYNPNTETYEAQNRRFYVLTPQETRAKYREVAVKAWDQGITRFLEGSHVFPEEYVTDYSYFVEQARKEGADLRVDRNPLYWWVRNWLEKHSASGFINEGKKEKGDDEKITQLDLDEMNHPGNGPRKEETPAEKKQEREEDLDRESARELMDKYTVSQELRKTLHRLFRSGEVGFDRKGFFDAVVDETDPGLLLGKDNLTHQVSYDGKTYKIFYV